ncbi:MAG: polyamine ABC transporter substrate-binding protein [Proteobacteria bacterium]|nr:polyamine ABC transporter substrate-binding protein [Pseudomonadota bacterium]
MRAANSGLAAACLLLAAALPAAADEKTVNVYNWSDLIGAETLAAFTAATGITVQYDTYDSDEVLETKLLTGGSGYDVVAPSATFLPHQVQAGVLMELDRTKIPNWGNLDPSLLTMVEAADPGNKHAIIFDWGTTGLIVNSDAVAERLPGVPTDSYALLFDPANAVRLKDCGIAVLDSPADVVPIVLKYLGLSPDSEKPEDLARAKQALLAIRPYLRSIHSSSYLNDLAGGSLCAAIGWSGDATIAQARADEAKNGVHLRYIVPKEGTLSWFGMMAIPADAPHPDQAHAFLNYMLEPKVAADFTSSVGYANAIPKSAAFMKPEIAGDPTTFPPADVKLRLFPSVTASPAYDRERTRAWTDFKTGQ